jgi:hypothetical protein
MATARELRFRHRVQQLSSAGFRKSAAQLNAFDVYCLCRERRPLDGPARRKHRHLFDSPISDVESCWVTLFLLVEQCKNCAIWDELREIRFLGKRRMAEVASNRAAFGLAEVITPCLEVPACAADPSRGSIADTFLVFHEIHATTATHALIGAAATAAVIPEPSTLMLGLGALGLLSYGWQHRKRA